MTPQGGGVRFQLAGIPVRIDWSFFIIGVLFSMGGEDIDLPLVAVILLVFGVSILVHEMGHALLARTTGADPAIVLHGFGGLTSWSPSHEVTRLRHVAISLAGPLAGLALGLVCLALQRTSLGDAGTTSEHVLRLAVLINVFYGLFNLLPILPLDGGQIMRDVLPGGPASRERAAAAISVVVGAAAAVVAWTANYQIPALFVAFFAATNLTVLLGGRGRGRPARPTPLSRAKELYDGGRFSDAATAALRVAEDSVDDDTHSAAIQLAAWARLAEGRADEAKALLLDLPPGSVDPVLEGKVLVGTGHVLAGLSRLRSAYQQAHGELAAYELAASLARAGHEDELVANIADTGAPTGAFLAASYGAHAAGAYLAAVQLAERAGSVATSEPERAAATYAVARSAARAGEVRQAVECLRAAVAMAPGYADTARRDPELQVLHGLPEFADIVGG